MMLTCFPCPDSEQAYKEFVMNSTDGSLLITPIGHVPFRTIVDSLLHRLLVRGPREKIDTNAKHRIAKLHPSTTEFSVTLVERRKALEGSVQYGSTWTIADRYGIRDRGIILRTETERTYVLKFSRYGRRWTWFHTLFDEGELNRLSEQDRRRRAEDAHSRGTAPPRGNPRSSRDTRRPLH